MTVQNLRHARDIIAIGLPDTRSHEEAMAYVDGWAGADMPYCVDVNLWDDCARGREERIRSEQGKP